jgi:hypothetical protein
LIPYKIDNWEQDEFFKKFTCRRWYIHLEQTILCMLADLHPQLLIIIPCNLTSYLRLTGSKNSYCWWIMKWWMGVQIMKLYTEEHFEQCPSSMKKRLRKHHKSMIQNYIFLGSVTEQKIPSTCHTILFAYLIAKILIFKNFFT